MSGFLLHVPYFAPMARAALLGCTLALLATSRLANAAPPPPLRTAAQVAAALAQARTRLDPPDPAALVLAQRAEAAARALANDTLRGHALAVQGQYYWETTNPAHAVPLLRRAVALLEPASAGARAKAWRYLAAALTDARQRRPAVAAYRQAYALAGQAPADSAAERAEIENSLGVFYLTFDQPDSAAYFLFRALRRQKALGRVAAQATTLVNLGTVFYQRQQTGAAVGYLRQALRLQIEQGDSLGQANSLRTLGAIAALLPTPDSLRAALRYSAAARRLLLRLGQRADALDILQTEALTYTRLGEPDSAEQRFQAALRLCATTDDSLAVAYPMLGLAELLQKQHRFPEAAALATRVQALARRQGQAQNERAAVRLLGSLAAARADYRAALAYAHRERTLTDSLVRQDNRRLTAELRARYETDQAEQRVAVLEKDRELVRLRQQRTVAGLGAGLVLLLAGAASGVARYRRCQRRREAALRQQLAADLHDEVGSLLTQVALESALLRHAPAAATQIARLDRITDASQRAVRHLRDVVWSVDGRHDSFSDLLDRMRDHAAEVLATAAVELDFAADAAALSPQPLRLAAQQALYLIFKEALHNVVKHAAATEVCVQLTADGRWLELTIADDGCGLPAPLSPAAHNGHGLANMRQRAATVGGNVAYETPPTGRGLLVRVRLPLR